MQNVKTNIKLYTTEECATATGIPTRKIRELCNDGKIRFQRECSRRLLVDLDDLKEYLQCHKNDIPKPRFMGNPKLSFGDAELEFDEVMKPICSYNLDYEIFNLELYEFDSQYLVTNRGRIFNATTGIFLKPDIKNTYYYVNLTKDGKHEHVYNHRVTAYFFCSNRHYKDYVHHIDGNPLNNNAKNLIWVTSNEHSSLHKLLRDGNKKEYRQMISAIRKDNKWII